MTPLKSKVVREYPVSADHRGRHIVVELRPPSWIVFREKGGRDETVMPVQWLYQRALETKIKNR